MAISILAPAPAEPPAHGRAHDSDDDIADDLDGDVDMLDGARPTKRARLSTRGVLVTPGEVVTADPQWMR